MRGKERNGVKDVRMCVCTVDGKRKRGHKKLDLTQ